MADTGINFVDHKNGYSSLYYSRATFGEPRQRMWAVLRYEKHSIVDDPGFYIKKVTNDQNELKIWAKEAVDHPNSDGQGWVSNIGDVMIVEILPTDTFYKTV